MRKKCLRSEEGAEDSRAQALERQRRQATPKLQITIDSQSLCSVGHHRWSFQWHYRDPAGPTGFHLSAALALSFYP